MRSRAAHRGKTRMLTTIIRLIKAHGMPLVAVGMIMPPASAADLNDYPTAARVDYVFACMKANGETRQTMEQCSCSIDVIASLLPYERYVAGESVLSLSQVAGSFGSMFRTPE